MDPNSPQPGQTVQPGSSQNQPQATWKFDASPQQATSASIPRSAEDPSTITWSASEYVAHSKTAAWYLVLLVATFVLAALVYLLTRDKISTVVVFVAAVFFAYYAARRPRTLNYKLDENGLTIGQKFYDLNQFKSFSAVQEGAFSGIVLLPLKRFMPPLEIYYDPKDQDKIANILINRLPFEDRKLDPVDNFVRRIRF